MSAGRDLNDEVTRLLTERVTAQLASNCGVTVERLMAGLARVAADDDGQADELPLGAPLSVRDVARRIGRDHQAVRRAIKRGDLVAYKPGSRLIVYERDFERWLSRCRVTQARPIEALREPGCVAPPSPPSVGLRRLPESK